MATFHHTAQSAGRYLYGGYGGYSAALWFHEDQYDANATGKIQPEELKKAWKEIADYYRVEQLRVATIIENNEPIIKDESISPFNNNFANLFWLTPL